MKNNLIKNYKILKSTVMIIEMLFYTKKINEQNMEQAYEFINSYYGAIGEIIEKYNGNTIKLLGGTVLVLFKESDKETEVQNAINAARGIMKLPGHKINISIHHGKLLYGDFGYSHHNIRDIIGDAVNIAFRQSALDKRFAIDPPYIIISSEAFRLLTKKPGNRKIGEWPVKGMNRNILSYEIIRR